MKGAEIWMCVGESFSPTGTWRLGFCGDRGTRGFWLTAMQAGSLGPGAVITQEKAKLLEECSAENFRAHMEHITGKRFEKVKA